MARQSALPASLAPRLIRLEAAAEYVSLSTTKFLELVKEGRAPRPRQIDRRKAWDVRDLDRFAEALPYDGGAEADSTWDD
ncbi:hypothetical protein GJ654_04275 [Rhodoblastus acidophilus]|uniref:Transcriptional regulator, AlpA family n=1 Tax=Rhodoblastus acidophilus TaxID=1074 RepID=A0A6N8DL03_RHOAC|nr:hypothetical protein [Rhodoblastus acidophilus]MCW2273313.1 putative DNA-binding transcriptional regulator AlpA [Rhodoblastus acidophilus]MTV30205.1 hypothetical protein [Rhodoblastus acidophilus]